MPTKRSHMLSKPSDKEWIETVEVNGRKLLSQEVVKSFDHELSLDESRKSLWQQ